MTFTKTLIRAGAMLAAATAIIAAPPAAAQLGGVLNKAKKRAEQEVKEAAEEAVAKTLFPGEEDSFQVRRHSPHLDSWDFGEPADMSGLERTSVGGFELRPGLWEFNAQSYCLHMGSYERTGGSGYLSSQHSGKLAPYLTAILQGAYHHPEIPQARIQTLLWSVMSGLEIKSMNEQTRQAARALLTGEQYRALDGGAASFAPSEITSKMRRSLPRSVVKALDTHDHMRRVASRPGSTYEDLEEIAVLGGDPPRNTKDDVPSGRWSWHPDGYLIRYFSERYKSTRIQIMVGEKLREKRDALGRIVELKLPDGAYIRASYRDDIEPYTLRKFPTLAAYAFASVEYGAPNPAGGAFLTQRYDNQGYTWVTDRRSKHTDISKLKRYAALIDAGIRSDASPMILAQFGDVFDGARDRAERVRDLHDGVTTPVSEDDVRAILDRGHYREGAETLTGDTGDRLDWIGDMHMRVARAVGFATEEIDSLGEGDGAIYDPSSERGHPVSESHVQLRGLSARPYP